MNTLGLSNATKLLEKKAPKKAGIIAKLHGQQAAVAKTDPTKNKPNKDRDMKFSKVFFS